MNDLLQKHIRTNLWFNPGVSPECEIRDVIEPYTASHTEWNGLVPDYRMPEARRIMLDHFKKHQLDLRVAEEYWDVEAAEEGIWPEKYVVIVRPKSTDPGTVAPMAAADTSGEYAVYYYAAYRDGQQLWEIDKRRLRCVIMGTDYMADVRKALGK